MPRVEPSEKVLILVLLVFFSFPLYGQDLGWAKKYEPLRRAIPASDLKAFTLQIKEQKPQLYQTFFINNPQFRSYHEPSCPSGSNAHLDWASIGQGYYGLALTSLDQQRFEDFLLYSKVAYLNGIHENSGCSLNYLGLGELYLFIEKPGDALMFLKEAVPLVQDVSLKSRLQVDLGICYDLLGETVKSLQSFQLAEQGLKPSVAYYYYRAHATFLSGDKTKALETLSQAKALNVEPGKNSGPVPITAQSLQTLEKLITHHSSPITHTP